MLSLDTYQPLYLEQLLDKKKKDNRKNNNLIKNTILNVKARYTLHHASQYDQLTLLPSLRMCRFYISVQRCLYHKRY